MEPDNIVSIFKLVKESIKEFQSYSASISHLNWKGERNDIFMNSPVERINFFTPEFAAYVSSKLVQNRQLNFSNVPYERRLLCYNSENTHFKNNPYQLINRTFAHNRASFNIIFVPEKEIFVSSADDGCLCFWSTLTGSLLEKRKFHENPINHMIYCKIKKIIITSDNSGGICFVEIEPKIKLIGTIQTNADVDKIETFISDSSLRVFVAFKNGPYAILHCSDAIEEVYRSGASYKESAILKEDAKTSYFVVKTNAGLFSINYCRESQDTWFLLEEDPFHLLTRKDQILLIALCADGKSIGFEHSHQENRPILVCERSTNYDFKAPQLVQIFKNILVCVIFEGLKSHITVFSVLKDSFFNVLAEKTVNSICYYFAENPTENNVINFVTVDGSLFWMDINNGDIFQEKRLSVGINEMGYTEDGKNIFKCILYVLGKTLILLDDSGSISMFSAGSMPCDEARLVVHDENVNPDLFSAHLNFVSKIRDFPKEISKRKRESPQFLEDNKKVKESKIVKSEEPLEFLPYWSSACTNQAFPYVPQLKDSIVYFPKPHLEFLRRNGRKLKEKFEFEEAFIGKSYYEGIIDELEYSAGEFVKCKIVLRLMIGRKWTKIFFNYFFGINQPNYIVLKAAFISNAQIKFKENETVRIRVPPCQNENGIILEIRDESDSVPSFGSYKILCNKKDMTISCSSWEISKLRTSSVINFETIHPDDKISLEEIMQKVILDENWTSFRYPVDFSEYPEYYATIPYPMYLELIVKRLRNNYYRHIASFLWDINQITVDALLFNEADSDIVVESQELCDFVIKELKSRKIKYA